MVASLRPLSLWRQLKGLFWIYFQDALAYRASIVIWLLTDITTTLTMPLVFLAAGRGATLGGFSPSELVSYYVIMLFVSSFVTSHFMWEIGTEIREGILSTQLIRPVNWWAFMLVRNVAYRFVRSVVLIPFFVAFVVAYWGQIQSVTFYFGWETWVALILGHLVSFCFVVAFAMIALFTQEAMSIFELYYFPMLFLSGQLFPISLLPDWARTLALFFPFYSTTGAPVEIMLGRVSGLDALNAIGMQVAWIILSLILYQVLWRKGLKQFTGIGM
ncbi:MAG: ABC-2 family transporter protein [Fimbriimonadaceae bacterium]|nr:ABC-2 family transporter protein [Fimbriimonadaceae bacterium]